MFKTLYKTKMLNIVENLLCLKRCIKHKDVLKICTTKYFGKNLSSEQRLKAEDLLSTMYPK